VCDVCPPGTACMNRICCGTLGASCGEGAPCCPGTTCEEGVCQCLAGFECCDPAANGTGCPAARPHCCNNGVCGECCDEDQCPVGQDCASQCPSGERCHPTRVCVPCFPPGNTCATDFTCCSDICNLGECL
jgi:hypothetical protein